MSVGNCSSCSKHIPYYGGLCAECRDRFKEKEDSLKNIENLENRIKSLEVKVKSLGDLVILLKKRVNQLEGDTEGAIRDINGIEVHDESRFG